MTVRIDHPTTQDSLSLKELALYHQIMAVRAEEGLAPLRLSAGLTATAGRHVLDLRENIWGAGKTIPAEASLHSWSDATYYSDNSNPQAMWDAPQRLGTSYDGVGYELVAAGQTSGAAALASWKGSPGHLAVLTEQGAFDDIGFAAIGIGLDATAGSGPFGGRVYTAWFGVEADPGGAPKIVGTGNGDHIRATAFADRILAYGGDDVIIGGNGADRILAGGGDDRLLGGTGRDVLAGGAGADTFVFGSVAQAGRDRITDFRQGIDTLDLRGIDANPNRAGHQDLVIGDTLTIGEGHVSADLDHDGRAEFRLNFSGDTPTSHDVLL